MRGRLQPLPFGGHPGSALFEDPHLGPQGPFQKCSHNEESLGVRINVPTISGLCSLLSSSEARWSTGTHCSTQTHLVVAPLYVK